MSRFPLYPRIIQVVMFLAIQSGDSQFLGDKYYVSPNPTSWQIALHDCETIFEGNGTLVRIETEEEFDFLKETLYHYAPVGKFWTAGIYRRDSQRFYWVDSEDEVTDGTGWSRNPWDTELPQHFYTVSRIILDHNSFSQTVFSVESSTILERFICENIGIPQKSGLMGQ